MPIGGVEVMSLQIERLHRKVGRKPLTQQMAGCMQMGADCSPYSQFLVKVAEFYQPQELCVCEPQNLVSCTLLRAGQFSGLMVTRFGQHADVTCEPP